MPRTVTLAHKVDYFPLGQGQGKWPPEPISAANDCLEADNSYWSMSANASLDSIYATPNNNSSVIFSDTGASPELAGTTRSGKRRAPPDPNNPPAKKNRPRKMVLRSPKNPGPAPGSSSSSPRERNLNKNKKTPPRDEELTTSDLASIMTDGLAKMMAGMGKLECQISGRIDTVQTEIRDTNAAVSALETKFQSTAEDNNRRLQKLEQILGQPDVRNASDRASANDSSLWPSLSAPTTLCSDSGAPSYAEVSSGLASGPPSSSAGRAASRREASYWKSRRSLYLWPIKGTDPAQSVLEYVQTHLDFGPDNLGRADFTVEKLRNSKSKRKGRSLSAFRPSRPVIPFAPLPTSWPARRRE